ncbi:MAG: MBL fold metallo-hydrolase [bacterium]
MITALALIGLVFIMITALAPEADTPPIGRPLHHTENGFRNTFPTFKPHGGGAFLKWQWDRLRGQAPEKPESYDFKMAFNDGEALKADADDLRVTWVGHATTLVQIEGVNILTDPIFSERCSPVAFAGPKRKVPPIPAFENLPRVDAVLISHNHYDHLDQDTIKKLGNKPRYFVPLNIGKFLRDLGIKKENIVELDWWDSAEFRGLQFHCTPTQHFSGRGLHDTNQMLWCSWAVTGAQRRLYFGGDTGYFPGFKEIGEKLGPFDLAILPIGAYLPRWFMSPVHVNPPEALQAFLDVRGRNMLAIHWGTFDLADEPMDRPPKDLRAAADSLGIAQERVWVFQHGETREIAAK